MKVKYLSVYDFHDAEARFEIDTEKITEKDALEILQFFGNEQESEDIYEDLVSHISLECFVCSAGKDYNLFGIKDKFENKEGYPKLDGSSGIEIIEFEGYEFDKSEINVVKSES